MNRRADNLRSIKAMCTAAALFSLMDTAMKLLSATYPAMQVTALRALASLPLVVAWVGYRGLLPSMFHARWSLHLVRMGLGIVMLTLFAFAIKKLSLAEAYTLFFIAPALITALSVVILKERVDAPRWIAIFFGLLGVVVALRPEGDGFLTLGGLAVLGAAACYAVSAIVGRILSRTDSNEHMVFWLMTMVGAGATVLAAPEWVPLRQQDYLLLIGLAITGFFGQLAITKAFTSGEASVVAPFEYTALAWGVTIDWMLWNTLPDRYTLLGAAIIIASGIYLVRHEQSHAEAEHP
jgi:drug/metabolite transporter (DMT)-like permease